MIIRPRVRGFVCVTTHPTGCARNVETRIAHARARPIANPPRSVLVLGSSTSYGLGSRIALAFGGEAATFGVFFDRAPRARRPGTAGWYNTAAFEEAAARAGLQSASYNGDAFSHEAKARVVDALRRDFPPVDCVVNSVAAPRRTHPDTGERFTSVLKPIGDVYRSKTLNTDKAEVTDVELAAATREEVDATVAVMGGEDWRLWMDALRDGGVLAPGCRTFAYSYIGPELTWPIYRDGAIGRAKSDLHRTADELDRELAATGGGAHIAIMKAVVTQASAAIPVVPLYVSILYGIMKEKGDHEGPMEQARRLFGDKVYGPGGIETDEDRFIRLDDLEMKPETQAAVLEVWDSISTENLRDVSDFDGYRSAFLQLFGFEVPGVDYGAEVDPLVGIPGLVGG
ncbi:MAG: trans-2-enoyl-CoA reductase family protein [Gemmatimonadota bacterium]|nr:trans-2-enoyl-CoA reductase family protein [Gemmatimonadota bacterium]MDE2984294.1 trans-2-enoyl-CoA reductase family protein [Gemmatimonadota bacterium]